MTGSAATCRVRFAILALLLGFCTADIASADEADAWTALHAGRHVALMRHNDAPGGAGDPPGFRVDDCATQCNLSAKERADAARIGARLRKEGIAVERILSSPWCRRQRCWSSDRSKPSRHFVNRRGVPTPIGKLSY